MQEFSPGVWIENQIRMELLTFTSLFKVVIKEGYRKRERETKG